MTRLIGASSLLAGSLLLCIAGRSEAQEAAPQSLPSAERCGECHSGAAADVAAGRHAGVESRCSGCHGGDPTSMDERGAHRGKFRAVPLAVCATCHEAEAEAFGKGPHGVAFEVKAIRGCVECHAPHATLHPDPGLFRTACDRCHAPNAPEIVEEGRATADGLERLERALAAASRTLDEAEGRAMVVRPVRERLEGTRLAFVELLPKQHAMDLEPFQSEAAKFRGAAEEISASAEGLLGKARGRRRWALLVALLVVANAGAILWRRRAVLRTIPVP